MTRLGVFLTVAAVAAFFFVNVGVSEAESVGARQMAVVIADRDAIRASEDSGYLFESLFGLLTTLRPEDRMAFVPVQEPEDVVGPVGGAEADLRLMIADIDSIMAGTPLEPASLVDAMVEASSVMGDERALSGSDVYLIVADDARVALDRQHSNLAPLLSRFQENGWRVNGIMLPETTSSVKQFLGKMAEDSGGSVYDLSAEGGLTELGQAILSEDLRGSLSPLGQRDLYPSEVMTTAVDVSPGTEETTVIIVKETPDGSLRISNPDGLDSSQGDRSSSRVIETPHVVAWKLTDPAVGSWMVDIGGVEGRVSVWSHSTNRYSLVLGNSEPIPTGQPATISAYITEDGRPVKLHGITVVARLTTPDGANLAYTMNDNGENGDVVSGDGYYSVGLGPLQSIGEYETVLEMWWPDHTYMVSSGSSFTTSAFPAIRVEPGKLNELESGVRALVATVYVHVQGEPYAIQSEQLTASIGTPFEQGRRAALGQGKVAQGTEGQSLPTPTSAPEGFGLLEVEPQRLFGDGPAWEYQVYYTPSSEGRRDLFFDLDLEYSGVRYAHSSKALRLTSQWCSSGARGGPGGARSGRNLAASGAGNRTCDDLAHTRDRGSRDSIDGGVAGGRGARANHCRDSDRPSLPADAGTASRLPVQRPKRANRRLLEAEEGAGRGVVPQEPRPREGPQRTGAERVGLHVHAIGGEAAVRRRAPDGEGQQPTADQRGRDRRPDVDRQRRQALHVHVVAGAGPEPSPNARGVIAEG